VKRLVLISLLSVVLVGGCSTTPSGRTSVGMKNSPAYFQSLVGERNRGFLQLEVGMTKDEVRQILPNPRRREVTQGGTEYWFYLTEWARRGDQTRDDCITPVAFVDGKVVGWGRNFYVNREEKHRVKIE